MFLELEDMRSTRSTNARASTPAPTREAREVAREAVDQAREVAPSATATNTVNVYIDETLFRRRGDNSVSDALS
jgi:hypothetical protein